MFSFTAHQGQSRHSEFSEYSFFRFKKKGSTIIIGFPFSIVVRKTIIIGIPFPYCGQKKCAIDAG
jgi:hypothetical protein